jgi:hypothetical protein
MKTYLRLDWAPLWVDLMKFSRGLLGAEAFLEITVKPFSLATTPTAYARENNL